MKYKACLYLECATVVSCFQTSKTSRRLGGMIVLECRYNGGSSSKEMGGKC